MQLFVTLPKRATVCPKVAKHLLLGKGRERGERERLTKVVGVMRYSRSGGAISLFVVVFMLIGTYRIRSMWQVSPKPAPLFTLKKTDTLWRGPKPFERFLKVSKTPKMVPSHF